MNDTTKKPRRNSGPRAENNFPHDRAKGKIKPNSFVALFKSIRCFWEAPESLGNKMRSTRDFASSIEQYVAKISNVYNGYKQNDNTESWIKSLENRKENGISYIDIRIYAEYCHVPSALLVIYSHVCGIVEKIGTNKKIDKIFVVSFLDRLISSLELMKDKINSADNADKVKELFVNNKRTRKGSPDGAPPYSVKIDVLQDMRHVFLNSGDNDGAFWKTFEDHL